MSRVMWPARHSLPGPALAHLHNKHYTIYSDKQHHSSLPRQLYRYEEDLPRFMSCRSLLRYWRNMRHLTRIQ